MQDSSETIRTNKETLRRLLDAADRGDLEAVRACFSPEYLDHDPPTARRSGETSLEGAMAAFRAFQIAFPDTRHSIHELIAEGDSVAVRISAEGTHLGPLFGMEPTGRRLKNDSIVIYKFRNGLIAERWARERSSVLHQLGSQADTDER